MADDAGKIFVGGLPKSCAQEALQMWAEQFGEAGRSSGVLDVFLGEGGVVFFLFVLLWRSFFGWWVMKDGVDAGRCVGTPALVLELVQL